MNDHSQLKARLHKVQCTNPGAVIGAVDFNDA